MTDDLLFKDKHRQALTWTRLESSRPLPVRFELYASKRTNRALCPCLAIHHRNISIIRILDPEHRQPYISLDSIFLLANQSIPHGILTYGLSREVGDYDLTLAGLEPREALWAPLKVARRIADELNLLEPLSMLLDWDNRYIWSLDEGEEGLVHNWRAPQINVASYSTAELVRSDVKAISPLSKGQQIRTLVSQEQRQEASEKVVIMTQSNSPLLDSYQSKFEQRLLRWSVLACEELLRSRKEMESKRENDGTSRRKEEEEEEEEPRFEVQSSEMLILFQDYVKGLHMNASLDPVSLSPEEMSTTTLTNVPRRRNVSLEEVYKIARIHVTLIHHLWIVYLTQTASDPASNSKPDPTPRQTDIVSQRDMKALLDRLEETSKRTEWGLSELLLRKASFPQQQSQHQIEKWQCQVPYFGLLDARIFLALIAGVIIGSMNARV